MDTSGTTLSASLYRLGLHRAFPRWESFNFNVDITGLLQRGERAELVFVECSTAPLSLKDIGPLLARSVVASPVLSAIISPGGLSTSLDLLLNTYNRVDILEYGGGRRVKIARWDPSRKQVDPASVLPPGELG